MLNIEHVKYFIPEQYFSVEEELSRFNLTKAQAKVFSRIYGLERIPYAANMSVVELVKKPIQQLLDDSLIDKNDIKVLIHTHTANVILPFGNSVAKRVKEELGLNDALAFGMTLNNCASTLNALEVAAILLKNYDANAKAIVVVGEKAFTPTVQVIPNVSITADAAAAVLVSINGDSNKLLSLKMHTEGKYAKGIWLSPSESKDFETAYVPFLASTILDAVKDAKLTLADIKLILPHNVNLISWQNVAKKLGIELSNIYLNNVRRYAHCFGADIFINYADATAKKQLKKGDFYMMATVGLGATFAAAVFQY